MGILAQHYVNLGRPLTPAELQDGQHLATRIIKALYREDGRLCDVNSGATIEDPDDAILDVNYIREGGVLVGMGFEIHKRMRPEELAEAAKPLASFLSRRRKTGNLK